MGDAYDAVVIGTGFGGAVASCRLAQAGLRVGVLERGRRYDKPGANGELPFPRDLARIENGWLYADGQGLFDVRPAEEVFVLQAAGYGGGSLVYANVHLRPVPEVFASGWPEGYSREELDPYYDLVAHMLDVQPITARPGDLPPKTRLMAAAAERLGRSKQFYYPDLAIDLADPARGPHPNKFGVTQQGCRDCGECDIGCRYRAKNTLDMNYLALAERRGAEVRSRCEVVRIAPSADGYVVTYRDFASGGEQSVSAKAVFVCGGAINTTEMLLRCRDEHGTLPALSATLGKGYSGTGDLLAFASETKPPFRPDEGPTITTGLVYDRGQGAERAWFTLQDGGYPRALGRILQPLRAAGAGATSVVFLATGRDRANGRLELDAVTRRLRVRWDVPSNSPLYASEDGLFREVIAELAGEPAGNPLRALARQPVAVHHLGGCCMADDELRGVTDACGQVYGYPDLYVFDGASLPAATGVNPSHTIAAVAERNVERFIRRWKKDAGWAPPERAAVRPVADPLSRVQIPEGGTARPRVGA